MNFLWAQACGLIPNGPPPGELTCKEIWDCSKTCETDACFKECYDRGTTEAKQLDDAIGTCYNQNGCTDATCLATKCATQLAACGLIASNNSPGGLGCKGIRDCSESCNGDQSCYDACYQKGTAAAKQLDNAIGNCAKQNGCTTADCLSSKCAAEIQTCYAN